MLTWSKYIIVLYVLLFWLRLFLTIEDTHAYKHTLPLTHSHTLSLTHTNALPPLHIHSHTLSHTHTLTQTPPLFIFSVLPCMLRNQFSEKEKHLSNLQRCSSGPHRTSWQKRKRCSLWFTISGFIFMFIYIHIFIFIYIIILIFISFFLPSILTHCFHFLILVPLESFEIYFFINHFNLIFLLITHPIKIPHQLNLNIFDNRSQQDDYKVSVHTFPAFRGISQPVEFRE